MKCKILAAAVLFSLLVGIPAGCSSRQNRLSADLPQQALPYSINKEEVPLRVVRNTVKNAYGSNYIPNMEYPKKEIAEKFGLAENLYEDILAEGPIISTNADTFIAVKAKKGKEDDVEDALQLYRRKLMNEPTEYTSNQAKINASQIIRQGRYVFLLVLGNAPMSVQPNDSKGLQKAIEEQNETAVAAIKTLFSNSATKR